MPVPLLDAPESLHARLLRGEPFRLLDVRWRLDRPDGRGDYERGHLPGAVYVDLDAELAEPGLPAGAGRHPLPSPARLQAAARRWGLLQGESVVVYDDLGGMSAARAWWLLRDAGVADVRLLDGGLAAWSAAGLPVETGDVAPPPGDALLRPGSMPVVDLDAAAALPARGVLLDARAGERYRGEVEPIDPRAGHIPGAVSAPTAGNVDESGRFRTPAELRERFAALGVSADAPVAAYCGSGVTAAHEVFALALAGFDAALYPGSWSAWSNRAGTPVAVGAEPGAPEPREHPAVSELVRTVAVLRGPGGCPWDGEQTHASLVRYLVEECFELVEAIESGDPEAMLEELGDVLYQVLFHADLASATPGEGFDVDDVAARLNAKLISRHPHVFGDRPAANADEVVGFWDELKAAEKPHRTSILDGVPMGMPALALADKLLGKAEKAGVTVAPSAVPGTEEELGAELLALVAGARAAGLDPERALRGAIRGLNADVRAAEGLEE